MSHGVSIQKIPVILVMVLGGMPKSRMLPTVGSFVVIYTMRDSMIRIISARKANRREVREYERNTVDD